MGCEAPETVTLFGPRTQIPVQCSRSSRSRLPSCPCSKFLLTDVLLSWCGANPGNPIGRPNFAHPAAKEVRRRPLDGQYIDGKRSPLQVLQFNTTCAFSRVKDPFHIVLRKKTISQSPNVPRILHDYSAFSPHLAVTRPHHAGVTASHVLIAASPSIDPK